MDAAAKDSYLGPFWLAACVLAWFGLSVLFVYGYVEESYLGDSPYSGHTQLAFVIGGLVFCSAVGFLEHSPIALCLPLIGVLVAIPAGTGCHDALMLCAEPLEIMAFALPLEWAAVAVGWLAYRGFKKLS